MKAFRILIGLVIILSFSLGAGQAAALTPGTEPFTCSGDPADLWAQDYFFAIKDNNSCGVQAFYANSESEALNCAKKLCPDCTLEDISSLYQLMTPNSGNPEEQLCPEK